MVSHGVAPASKGLKERRRLADAIETGHQSFLGIMSHLKPILLSSFHEEDGDDDCGDEAMGNFDDEKVTKTMNAFKKLNEQYRAMDAQLVDSENTRLTNIKCAYGVNKSMLVDIPLNDTDKQLNEDIKTSNDKLRTEQQSIMDQRSTRDEHLARLREKHLAFQDMKSNKDLSKYLEKRKHQHPLTPPTTNISSIMHRSTLALTQSLDNAASCRVIVSYLDCKTSIEKSVLTNDYMEGHMDHYCDDSKRAERRIFNTKNQKKKKKKRRTRT
eukprot:401572_1